MSQAADESSHWDAYAARWRLVGEPLRPGVADLDYLRTVIARHLPLQPRPDRALLLGVTPEIANLDWRRPLQLLAIDKSVGMVNAVWPGDTATRSARVGDWLALDVPDQSLTLVVGDGAFSIFDYPTGYARLGAALERVLRPGGLLALRLFCRPEPCEAVDDVFAALFAGTIGNFHVFKWRLAMAMQGGATRGVRLADIWDTFAARVPSISALAARLKWPEPELANISSYQGVQDCYSFSTEREVVATLEPAFDLLETWRPSYELGERCPHVTFRKRA